MQPKQRKLFRTHNTRQNTFFNKTSKVWHEAGFSKITALKFSLILLYLCIVTRKRILFLKVFCSLQWKIWVFVLLVTMSKCIYLCLYIYTIHGYWSQTKTIIRNLLASCEEILGGLIFSKDLNLSLFLILFLFLGKIWGSCFYKHLCLAGQKNVGEKLMATVCPTKKGLVRQFFV